MAAVSAGVPAWAETIEYDLAADWSDVQNPNGPWSLKKSPSALFEIVQPDYWSDATGQLAWADEPFPQNAHVPFWMKTILEQPPTAVYPGAVQIGDILVDGAELGRTGSDVTSAVWTSPGNGTASISGAVWSVTAFDRVMSWELRKNGAAFSSGSIVSDGTYSRAQPFAFASGSGGAAALQQTVVLGDQIELLLRAISNNGNLSDILGVGLHIALTPGEPPIAPPLRSIVVWGSNQYGQYNVPSPNTDFTAVSAGWGHGLGLKTDGAIVAWGLNDDGQCIVPSPNTGFLAVSAGYEYGLGLKTDGSIVAWGRNVDGQCNVPSPNTGFTAVAAGAGHSLGLKSDGSIVAWGIYWDNSTVPAPNTGFVAVSAGYNHSLGLKADGSIVAWGVNGNGQCDVPAPNTGFTAVAAGGFFSLGLKSDGSVVAWGMNDSGQCNVPFPNSGFTAVAAGGWRSNSHGLGLKTDGSIVAWGSNDYGQCTVPTPNRGFTAVAGGGNQSSLGLRIAPLTLTVSDVPDDQGGQLAVSWPRHDLDALAAPIPVSAYDVQRYNADWQTLATVTAAQADSYTVDVATSDILTLGQPAPYSRYRVVAMTANPSIFYESFPDSAYSIDNIPPPAPVLTVEDDEAARSVFATGSRPSDYEETCFYKDQEPGFTPGDPIQCSTSRFYDEEHLRTYYYMARNFDIHGNASEWSNEVTGQYPTDVPGAAITQVRLYSNRPNPFNPMTTLRFDLPVAGQAQLSIYDLAGRLVRVLVEGEIPAGSHEAVWDGRDQSGRASPSGSYLARLVAGGKVEGVRLSLVR
jgi:hypothetical protein